MGRVLRQVPSLGENRWMVRWPGFWLFVSWSALGAWAGTWVASCRPPAPRPIQWHECEGRLSRAPGKRRITPLATALRRSLLEPAEAWLGLPGRSALDVNELDFVADSSWYENPAAGPAAFYGYRGRVRRGSPFEAVPSLIGKWQVVAAGTLAGRLWLAVRDGRGRAFVLTFDAPGYDGLATGAELIVTRLLGALGYFVPKRSMVLFRPGRLLWHDGLAWCKTLPPVSEGSLREFAVGRRGCRASRPRRARRALAALSHFSDGTVRALATRLSVGRDLGPFPLSGVRDDDPNDRIAHERRRSLRALRLIGAWLDLRGLGETTGRDLFRAGRVRHFLWFLSGGLGVSASGVPRGAAVRGGAGASAWPAWPEPRRTWHPKLRHPALALAQGPDLLWAARILAFLSPDRIRGLVSEAYLPPPLAESLTKRLLEARDKAVLVGRDSACPAGRFSVESPGLGPGRLCFEKLLFHSEATLPGQHQFVVKISGRRRKVSSMRGRLCVALPGTKKRQIRVEVIGSGKKQLLVVLQRAPVSLQAQRVRWRVASIRRF